MPTPIPYIPLRIQPNHMPEPAPTQALLYSRSTAAPAGSRNLLAELNPEQAAAASFSDGPLLVVAGAGTGKTRTLIYRVAHLLDRGVPPERLLLLTFTRRAAQEMLGRAERLVGSRSRQVHGGTFHGTAHRLLRRFGHLAGLPSDFTIMDQGDAEDLLQLSRAQLGLAETKKRRFPKKETLHYIYSRHVNTDIALADIVADEFPQFADELPQIERVLADYTRRKAERNLVDYDDLLLFWDAMVGIDSPVADRIASQYDHLLVDEYQDTNALQARILRGMCRRHRNLTVVGDDAQSIYAFRGASHRNILEFPSRFPGTTIVTLEQNYRSTQPILDVTNTLISRATERFTKNLWTRREGGERPWLVTTQEEQHQTRFVVERILELHEEGTPLREIAVLFRAGYMSADLEIELTNRRIPFEKWGGLKFLEAAHIKDVLAFLRILENPRDEVSWYRILLLLPGIGDATARSAIAAMADLAWHSTAFGRFVPPPRARPAHAALVALLDQMRNASEITGAVTSDIARVRVLYDDVLRQKYDRVEPRLADLDQLQTIASGYPSRSAFLSSLALEPPQGTQDLAGAATDEQDALVLSTVHSAKGKEWDAVFLIWAVDGWFPLARSLGTEGEIEEERRLMYVALTRARNRLAVTYPLNSYATRRSADYVIDQLSRFLDRGVRDLMDTVVLKPEQAQHGATAPEPVPAIDLRAMMQRRFGSPDRDSPSH
ncbi:MAG: DNA helicase II [Gemmatimonadaceae bacterium]|nr:DNA helicase II [Gemmatimonadaceae bacterium]